MTRIECEQKILEKLDEIREIYLQYNPGGDYLSLFCSKSGTSVNNEYWDGGMDEYTPIRAVKYQEEDDDDSLL